MYNCIAISGDRATLERAREICIEMGCVDDKRWNENYDLHFTNLSYVMLGATVYLGIWILFTNHNNRTDSTIAATLETVQQVV